MTHNDYIDYDIVYDSWAKSKRNFQNPISGNTTRGTRLILSLSYGGYDEMTQQVIEWDMSHVKSYAFDFEVAQNSNYLFFSNFSLEILITCLLAEVAHFF